MLRCSLSYAKVMQIECRTTSLLDCYAEMQLILCKDNANRVHGKVQSEFLSPLPAKVLYVINGRRIGGSLAIVRPVSLRPQNEGQKKRSRIKRMHTESLTRIFLTFVFSMHRDSKRICKRDRLRLLRLRPSNILSLI